MIPEKYEFNEHHPIIAATLWKVQDMQPPKEMYELLVRGMRAAYICGWTNRGSCFQETWMNTLESQDWASILKDE